MMSVPINEFLLISAPSTARWFLSSISFFNMSVPFENLRVPFLFDELPVEAGPSGLSVQDQLGLLGLEMSDSEKEDDKQATKQASNSHRLQLTFFLMVHHFRFDECSFK